MKRASCFCVCLILAWSGFVQGQEKVAPQSASSYIGKDVEVVVEFTVQSSGATKNDTLFFLNSSKQAHSAETLVVVIPAPIADQLQKKGVPGSLTDFFRGRDVKVTGKVTSYKSDPSPQIVLADASQITWRSDGAEAEPSFFRRLFGSTYTYLVGGGLLILVVAALVAYVKKGKANQ